jgi:hypothetical protein
VFASYPPDNNNFDGSIEVFIDYPVDGSNVGATLQYLEP